MKNDQIVVGESYYGYDCGDNGVFRLLRYEITSKLNYSCSGRLYQVTSTGNSFHGPWTGYPDNLYKTKEEAMDALKKRVEELENNIFQKNLVHLVTPVTATACCKTCLEYDPVSDTCVKHKVKIQNASNLICREGGYNCSPSAITRYVKEIQNK